MSHENETTIERIANDLTNGNLTDAKKAARRVSIHSLRMGFVAQAGWSDAKATAAAHYLKGPSQESFQAFCDAR